MSQTADRIAKLSAEKRVLLERLLKERQRANGHESIRPRAERDVFPLSFAQQRLWFLDQLDPGNPTYNLAGCLEFDGPLDTVSLERAINEIVRRHETLRTTFPSVGGRPVQVIAPPYDFKLLIVDLSEEVGPKQGGMVKRLLHEEAHSPFDLAKDFLMRTYLLRLADERHLLMITMHHMVCDGWSIQIFTDEVKILYRAFSEGKASPLAELPTHYADFAEWQQRGMNGGRLEEELSYWKRQLAGLPESLDLPTDRPRPLNPTYRGAVKRFALPLPLIKSLRLLSHKESVTMFMTLLAAFKVLLFRWVGQEDIVVGSSNINRSRPETKGLIGCFISIMVLRTDFTGDPSFRKVLRRVRNVVLDAYAHLDVPFERLVEILRPKRDARTPPLFHIMFEYQTATHKRIEVPDLTIKLLSSEISISKFDLTMFARERPEELNVIFEYGIDLFNAAAIERKAEQFVRMLEEIVAEPDKPVSMLSLMADAQRVQLIDDFNCSLV
jgi:hypothetical protein